LKKRRKSRWVIYCPLRWLTFLSLKLGYFFIPDNREHHRERMDLVWNALKKKSRPLYDLIDDVFAYVPEGHLFLAMLKFLFILRYSSMRVERSLSTLAPPHCIRPCKKVYHQSSSFSLLSGGPKQA
jgi:hypothetical protein